MQNILQSNLLLLLFAICGFFPICGAAQSTHHGNVLIGERGMGFGGAYTAIADDASAVFYNPAGAALAPATDLSMSVNGYYRQQVHYDNLLGIDNYAEKTSSTFSPFVGGTTQFDSTQLGTTRLAFGLYVPDIQTSELDLFLAANDKYKINSFHQTTRSDMQHNVFAAAIAKKFGGVGVGLSLALHLTQYSAKEFSNFTQGPFPGAFDEFQFVHSIIGSSIQLSTTGLSVGIGTIVPLSNSINFGAMIEPRFTFEQSYLYSNDTSTLYTAEADPQTTVAAKVNRGVDIERSKEPTGPFSWRSRMGVAYLGSGWTAAFDVSHHSRSGGDASRFTTVPVTNYALGAEFGRIVPIRIGVFTNRDARPQHLEFSQRLDWRGASLFFVLPRGSSTYTAGFIGQVANGSYNVNGDGGDLFARRLSGGVGIVAKN